MRSHLGDELICHERYLDLLGTGTCGGAARSGDLAERGAGVGTLATAVETESADSDVLQNKRDKDVVVVIPFLPLSCT